MRHQGMRPIVRLELNCEMWAAGYPVLTVKPLAFPVVSMRISILIFCFSITSSVEAVVLPVREAMLSEEALFSDADDGRIDMPLFTAALAASQATPAESRRLQLQYLDLLKEARQLFAAAESQLAAASDIHALMHERVFSGQYTPKCTSLVDAMESGNFNCVSATILFQSLTTPCGLMVTPIATPSHVYCRIELDSPVDVQTTCADWFEFMDRPDLQQAALARTPGYSPNIAPRSLTTAQLIGKIYYNRGVYLLNDKDFSDAERNFVASIRFDQTDQSTHENLLATWNNWALQECHRSDYSEASKRVIRGLEQDAQYGPFQTNDLHIHQRWAQALCREGKYAEASRMLKTCRQRRPDATLFKECRRAVYGVWIRSLTEDGQYRKAEQVLKEARLDFPDDVHFRRSKRRAS
ncbi:MAG: tetratricopeptide repeat protein [Pirellulaceae bacterium]